MMAIVEDYLRALGSARSDSAITKVFADAAITFGFRSA